ncbi:hypothetical protein JCM10908_002641 [Rhodotorula pacifica]|uniref:F1F0 ATP synthase subunit 5 n=1 Tax=Rhodotorula pacifica TaxID=1495444 RepID=UPI00316FDF19
MFSRRAAQAVRSYATQANTSVAPPIQIQGLAGKYAGALFTAAAKANALQQVESDLKGVKATVGTDAKIHDFLSNPILSHADRASGLDALLSASAGGKGSKGPSDLTRNLFSVLAENGRLYETDKVVDGFLEIMQAHRGEVKVTITTAQPLEKDLQKRLEDALKQSQVAQNGKNLVFENRINEAALGGVIIDVGDKTIDLSVASRVSRLNQQLEEGI